MQSQIDTHTHTKAINARTCQLHLPMMKAHKDCVGTRKLGCLSDEMHITEVSYKLLQLQSSITLWQEALHITWTEKWCHYNVRNMLYTMQDIQRNIYPGSMWWKSKLNLQQQSFSAWSVSDICCDICSHRQ